MKMSNVPTKYCENDRKCHSYQKKKTINAINIRINRN